MSQAEIRAASPETSQATGQASNTLRVVLAVPTAGRVAMSFAYSLAGLVAHVAANGIKTRPTEAVEMRMDIVESSVIHTNREQLCRRAIDAGMTHLLFLDDDMTFEPSILSVLLGRRHPVVCSNYLIKTEPARDFVAIGLDGKRVATTEASTGIQPIAYSGFGACLLDINVLTKTPQPWFLPRFVPDAGTYTTEDCAFFERVRAQGIDVYLDHDASKLLTHVGKRAWSWREVAANG